MGIKAAYSKDRQTRVVAQANQMFQFEGRDKENGRWFKRGPATDHETAMRNLGPTVEG